MNLAAGRIGIVAVVLCGLCGRVADAQTRGRVSIGASFTVASPTDDNVDRAVSVGPLVRLNPKRGWGPAGAFNWFETDLVDPDVPDLAVARLRVRPVMAGVAYTVGPDRVLTSFSIVAGPSFNSVEVTDEFRASLPAGAVAGIDIRNSVAVRPGVGVTVTVAPRVAIVGFGGFFVNRPTITFRNQFGQELRDRWKADAVMLSAGVVYSLF